MKYKSLSSSVHTQVSLPKAPFLKVNQPMRQLELSSCEDATLHEGQTEV